MICIPSTVATYLKTVYPTCIEPVFLHLDEHNYLIEWSDPDSQYGLENLEKQMCVVDQLPFLLELLPCSDTPLIMPRVQLLPDRYHDLHLFSNELGQWIIFLDTTITTLEAREQQQARLSGELLLGALGGR